MKDRVAQTVLNYVDKTGEGGVMEISLQCLSAIYESSLYKAFVVGWIK